MSEQQEGTTYEPPAAEPAPDSEPEPEEGNGDDGEGEEDRQAG